MKSLGALIVLLLAATPAPAQLVAVFTTNITSTSISSTQYVRTQIQGSMVLLAGTTRITYFSEVVLKHCSERSVDSGDERAAYFEGLPTPARPAIHSWLLTQFNSRTQ